MDEQLLRSSFHAIDTAGESQRDEPNVVDVVVTQDPVENVSASVENQTNVLPNNDSILMNEPMIPHEGAIEINDDMVEKDSSKEGNNIARGSEETNELFDDNDFDSEMPVDVLLFDKVSF